MPTFKHQFIVRRAIMILSFALVGLIVVLSTADALTLREAFERAKVPPNGGSAPSPGQVSGGTPSGGTATAPSSSRWSALSAGIWKVQGRVNVAVGSAIKFRTKAEAIRAALRQCQDAGGRNCKIASTFNRGCGYITTGRNRRAAGWVARASVSETTGACRAKGYRCKTPIGGCN